MGGSSSSRPDSSAEILNIVPQDARFWWRLGRRGGGTVAGTAYSNADCYIEVLKIDPKFTVAWFCLGRVGGGTVAGASYSATDCFIEALKIAPHFKDAWNNLGYAGGGTVAGTSYSAADCCIEALKMEAWHNLGGVGGGTVAGTSYSKADCYIEVLKIDPKHKQAWGSLGIAGGGTVAGTSYSKADCYIEALKIDPNFKEAWGSLGIAGGGTVAGTSYSQAECYIEVLKIDPKLKEAWHNLGYVGGGTVAGTSYSGAGCFIEALKIDPKFMVAWNGLGCAGGGTVAGTSYSEADCYIEALKIDPDNEDAWNSLMKSDPNYAHTWNRLQKSDPKIDPRIPALVLWQKLKQQDSLLQSTERRFEQILEEHNTLTRRVETQDNRVAELESQSREELETMKETQAKLDEQSQTLDKQNALTRRVETQDNRVAELESQVRELLQTVKEIRAAAKLDEQPQQNRIAADVCPASSDQEEQYATQSPSNQDDVASDTLYEMSPVRSESKVHEGIDVAAAAAGSAHDASGLLDEGIPTALNLKEVSCSSTQRLHSEASSPRGSDCAAVMALAPDHDHPGSVVFVLDDVDRIDPAAKNSDTDFEVVSPTPSSRDMNDDTMLHADLKRTVRLCGFTDPMPVFEMEAVINTVWDAITATSGNAGSDTSAADRNCAWSSTAQLMPDHDREVHWTGAESNPIESISFIFARHLQKYECCVLFREDAQAEAVRAYLAIDSKHRSIQVRKKWTAFASDLGLSPDMLAALHSKCSYGQAVYEEGRIFCRSVTVSPGRGNDQEMHTALRQVIQRKANRETSSLGRFFDALWPGADFMKDRNQTFHVRTDASGAYYMIGYSLRPFKLCDGKLNAKTSTLT